MRSFFLSVLLIFVSIGTIIAQCSMCRASVENNVSNGDTTVAAGLNLGILYLFAAPYIMVLTLGFLWYKKSRSNANKIVRRLSDRPGFPK